MRGSGEARLVASGAVLQQLAQGLGLVALLGIVTLLARRLEVAELGAYGLVASLAGYLLVLRNSVASSAVRAMASATDPEERSRVFAAAAALYVVVGLATGVLIAAAALAIAALVLDGDLARQARIGGLGLGALTAVGIAASVYLDALRAERRFAQAAGAEMAAVVIYVAVMVTLILTGASLGALMAVSGALPLLSGLLCALIARRSGLPRGLARSPAAGDVSPRASTRSCAARSRRSYAGLEQDATSQARRRPLPAPSALMARTRRLHRRRAAAAPRFVRSHAWLFR